MGVVTMATTCPLLCVRVCICLLVLSKLHRPVRVITVKLSRYVYWIFVPNYCDTQ